MIELQLKRYRAVNTLECLYLFVRGLHAGRSGHCHVAGDCCKPARKSAISGSSGQLPPLPKRLASKFFHGAAGRKVAINVEEVIGGGMNIQKALC